MYNWLGGTASHIKARAAQYKKKLKLCDILLFNNNCFVHELAIPAAANS
jgi:hypothetical protein